MQDGQGIVYGLWSIGYQVSVQYDMFFNDRVPDTRVTSNRIEKLPDSNVRWGQGKDPVLIDYSCVIGKDVAGKPAYLTERPGCPVTVARHLHPFFKYALLRVKLQSQKKQAGNQDQYPFFSTCRPHQILSILSRQKAVSPAFHDRMEVKGSANYLNNCIMRLTIKAGGETVIIYRRVCCCNINIEGTLQIGKDYTEPFTVVRKDVSVP